jgi:hypothetical protein
MRSFVIVSAGILALSLSASCVNVPGVTSPIPQMSAAERSKVCADLRASLAKPERFAGSHKMDQDALKGNNCPPQ